VSSERRQFARDLRRRQTRAEEILWDHLRGSRFHGAKFRRQVPFGGFVVDFYCHATKLVVEVDGKQHDWFSEYDKARTDVLERGGLQIMRVTNEDVLGNIDSVLARIREALRLPFS
jgi:very-short-patch-repair endonuclease